MRVTICDNGENLPTDAADREQIPLCGDDAPRRVQRIERFKVEITHAFGVSLVQLGIFQHSPSTTTVLYK